MGASVSSSASGLMGLSAADIACLVRGMGPAYEQYSAAFERRGVHGCFLECIRGDQMRLKMVLDEVGVQSLPHRRALLSALIRTVPEKKSPEESELVAKARDGSVGEKKAAVRTLSVLAGIEEYQIKIAEAGGIPVMLSLLRDGSGEVKSQAACVIRNLVVNTECVTRFVDAGGISGLVAVVRDGNIVCQVEAVGALRVLTSYDEHQLQLVEEDAIEALVSLLSEGATEGKREAVLAIHTFANKDNQHTTRFIEAGAIEALVSMLSGGAAEGRIEAAGTLQTLAKTISPQGIHIYHFLNHAINLFLPCSFGFSSITEAPPASTIRVL